MEKGEKASPTPSTHNIFDAASLLGSSPFAAGLSALPFGHLAHLPGAFSMLGHPAFPVSSLFGRLGDGLTSPLGSPSSLATSLSSSAVKHGLFSSPPFSKSSVSPPSKPSKSSSVSPPSKPSPSTSARKPSPSGVKQKTPGARGRPRKLTKQPPIPLSLVSGTSILSPSQLEKFIKKRDAGATNGLDDSGSQQKATNSRASHNGHTDGRAQKKVSPRGRGGSLPSRASQKTSNAAVSLLQDSVHIDSLKKKLIADQIRQRMQNKAASSSGNNSGKKRGRGRPPKISKDLSPKEAESQKVKQEELKQQLEAELKQQQMALRMLKKANATHQETPVKPNSVFKDKHGIFHKAIKSPKETSLSPTEKSPKLFSKVNMVHKERDKEAKRASISPTDHVPKRDISPAKSDSKVAEREISPTKSDSTPTTVKHVGLLNLVRQRSPEKALQSPKSSSELEESLAEKPEPHVAKFKKTVDKSSNVSSAGDSDSSESSGSSSSSSSSDSSDEEESKSESGSTSTKRPASDSAEGSGRPIKRRCVILDESHLRVPLAHGWKRQTHIHTYGRRGIVGEVWYFAPCGRKMKTIPDVMRYLERNSVTEFGRDNFSFNTKVNVGEFFENRSGGENGYVKLSASEIDDRLAVTLSRRQKKIENQKKQEKINLQQAMAKKMMDAKIKQKLQHQEMARKVAEMQFKKRLEKQQQKELFRRAKQMRILEKRKQKEQQRLMRERERLQREEELRRKRDMRTHQILEKQQEKARLAQERQYLKAVKKAEERELKRQQTAMLKEQMRLKQEQERQRQHILLLKALEQRKKLEVSRLRAEDRERQKEEKIVEKRMNREKKTEQRRMEFVLAMELKKPREDMELRDSKPMPEFKRIEGCVLDGEAFADCLMSLEFLHNFAAALGFDKDTLPTMKGLQDAVTSKTDEDGEEYLSLVSHLLRYALDDPGVPNPKEAVTRLGQKIVDIEVTDAILPEVLRVFMVARNGRDTELSEYLKTRPLEACSVSQRASVLAFLCNELNCSKNIITEIERSLDHMGDIRRDKWVVDGKLRRLRLLQAKKFNRPVPKPIGDGDSSIADGEDSLASAVTSKQNSEDEDGSGNESDGGSKDESYNDNEEDDPTTLEECEKQMEKLQKQHAQYRDKVFDASHKVRAIILGQDRYKRTYWVLPCAGGVYVEGMESGELNFDGEEQRGDSKEKVKTETQSDLDRSVQNKAGDTNEAKMEIQTENLSDKTEKNSLLHNNLETILKEGGEKQNCEPKENLNEIKESVECKKQSNDGQTETEHSTSNQSKTGVLTSLSNSDSMGEDKNKTIPNGELVVDNQESRTGEATLSDKIPPQRVSVSGNDTQLKCSSKNVELKIPSIKPCAISSHDNMNLFLQVPSSTKLSDFCNISSTSDSKTVTSNNLIMSTSSPAYISSSHMAGGHVMSPANHIAASLPSPPKPPPAHSSKRTSETKLSFMSIDSILKKEPETSQTNQFFPPGVGALSPYTNTLLKDSPTSDGKPWFSILPRVPCDDMSLTRGQHQSFSAGMFTSPPYISPISSFRSFPVPSPTFSSFQMGQIFGSTSSYSVPGTPSSSGMSTPVPDPFKVPDVPNRSCQSPDPEEVLKTLQGEAKPIPEEFQKGWWKISDQHQVRQLQRCLHPRGIREKNLHKTIQKFSEYTTNSCTKGKKEVISLESSDSESEEEESGRKTEGEGQTDDTSPTDEQKTDAQKNDTQERKRKKKKEVVIPVIDCKEKAHEADLIALEEVQTMEDRISSASLQIKGWKLQPKVGSEESNVKIIPRWQTKTSEAEQYPLEVAIERLLQVESNIERRYLKPPLCKVQKINVNSTSHENDDKIDGIETVLSAGLQTWRSAVAKATSPAMIMLCIIQLNNAISWEKSIMKVLCQICRKDDNEAQLLLCDGCDRGYHTYCFKPKMESVPEGDWYCFECISKAVGESCCLVCGRRFGKMAECYSCPRAVHLDCLDPPLPRIPRKWFCAACEDERGVKRRPRKNSTASTTSNSTPTSSSPRKTVNSAPPPTSTTTTSNSATPASNNTTPVQQPLLTPTGRKRRCDAGIPRKKKNPEAESPEKKEEKQNGTSKSLPPLPGEELSDMVMCRLILMEMEKHEDGWPFLQPVNCKQFTSYRKFIKNPMDFSTMKQKLRDSSYKTRGDFAADAQLVFDNCKTFNEDESEVGHCGHTMRRFFNKRWKELLSASADEETDEASPS